MRPSGLAVCLSLAWVGVPSAAFPYATAFERNINLLHFGQYSRGVDYELGRGVPRDPAQAARWYRRVAEQGCQDAQSSLGRLYESGRGVARDLVQAYRWYHLAAEQGHANAMDNRAVLAGRMTAEQIERARQLAGATVPPEAAQTSQHGETQERR